MKTKIVYLFLLLVLFSCSNDDNTYQCSEENSSMKINGEMQTFQTLGYGIDLVSLNPISHKLQINLYRSTDGLHQQNIYFIIPFKKTGKNKMTEFHYLENNNGQSFEGDFIDGEFTCNVKSNSNKCFYATISGKLTVNGQTVEIKDGIVSVIYETPFDE